MGNMEIKNLDEARRIQEGVLNYYIGVCLVLILVDCVLKKSCYRLSINVKKTDNPFLILK